MSSATDTEPGAVVPPEVTAHDAVDALVAASHRTTLPLRRSFIATPGDDGDDLPGPLGRLVTSQDRRALLLYLLLVTKASSGDWETTLPASVWARALGVAVPQSKTAASTISKTWLRLETHSLVKRSRAGRLASVRLLREDGSGEPYELPATAGDSYLQVPCALWTSGPGSGDRRWYELLSLPELAVLIITRSRSDRVSLPLERAPQRFGISPDTLGRGLKGLVDRDLLAVDQTYVKRPLSPIGYSAERRYTLNPPFGPIGKLNPAAKRTIGRKLKKASQ